MEVFFVAMIYILLFYGAFAISPLLGIGLCLFMAAMFCKAMEG
jgi:hypothetical protein